MASIDHLRSGQPLTTNRGSQNKPQSTSADKSTTAETGAFQKATHQRGDAVSLSEQSRAIGALNQKMASEAHFDSAKVAAIKEAIANGSYKVDAEQLASNMMQFEDELRGIK